MKRIALLAGFLPLLMTASLPANAAVHEIVAAYCSGGDVGAIDAAGFLRAPGVNMGAPGDPNFAAPVLNSGVVVGTFPNLEIGVSPAAKYEVGVNPLTALGAPVHPSADNCANLLP